MIKKLINNGIELLSNLYQNEPYITIATLLTLFIIIVCCIYLFKYLIVILFAFITAILVAFYIHSYMETRTLEYQLAQQMIAENCTDTIELELYLRYENITFIGGRQYRYGQVPADSIVRNYVCHSSKRTYSVDFLLDVYKNRPTLKDHIESISEDLNFINKSLDNKDIKSN